MSRGPSTRRPGQGQKQWERQLPTGRSGRPRRPWPSRLYVRRRQIQRWKRRRHLRAQPGP
eukprot:13815766-Alexandrium_andersonii.AAC.1